MSARAAPIPPAGRITARAVIVALAAGLAMVFASVAAADDPPTEATPTAPDPAGAGDLRRSRHSGLWPFYSSEVYDDGGTRTTSLFGAIRSESEPDGDYRHRVFPLYDRTVTDGGRDRRLAIFPLLYLGRRSPPADHDIVLPLFARWRSGMSHDTLLWPLFHVARRRSTDPFRFVPTLFASGSWSKGSQQRFGLPLLLDIFERSDASDASAWTLGALFPWGPPARFGLSLVRSRDGKSDGSWHFHVAPLVFAGEGAEGSEVSYVHTPLLGSWRDRDAVEGTSLPLVLTWWSSRKASEADERSAQSSVDVAWPLFHRSERGDDESALRVLPFWDHSVDVSGEDLGAGIFLYRRHTEPDLDLVAHSFLAPLVRHVRGRGVARDWALPFWYDATSETEAWREATTVFAPFWFEHREDERSEDGAWHTTTSAFHTWPFYGRHVVDSLDDDYRVETRYTVAPLFRHERTTRPSTQEVSETVIDAPWPIVRHASTPTSFDTRLFPLFATGRGPERAYWRTWPLVSVESGDASESGVLASTSVVQWLDRDSRHQFRLFPFLFEWRQDGPEQRITGPLWIFRYRDSGTDGWFHLLPLGYGSWDRDRSDLGIFPLWRRRNFGDAPIERWSLARFFFAWNSLRNDAESYDAVLWKAVESSRSREGDHDFRILHRLFVDREVDGQSELVLNPFFSSWRDERAGESSLRVLGFVFQRRVADGIATTYLFGIPIASGPVASR